MTDGTKWWHDNYKGSKKQKDRLRAKAALEIGQSLGIVFEDKEKKGISKYYR